MKREGLAEVCSRKDSHIVKLAENALRAAGDFLSGFTVVTSAVDPKQHGLVDVYLAGGLKTPRIISAIELAGAIRGIEYQQEAERAWRYEQKEKLETALVGKVITSVIFGGDTNRIMMDFSDGTQLSIILESKLVPVLFECQTPEAATPSD